MSEAGQNIIIKVRGLVNRFGDYVVHDHVNLDVKRGEVLAIVGGSGSGKSVLLRSMIGLHRPDEGSIEVFGQEIRGLSLDRMRALDVRWGVLFQDGALFSSQTVAENIEVPLREHLDMPEELMSGIAALKLSMVGLPEDTAKKYPSELSGGMRKRAGLADRKSTRLNSSHSQQSRMPSSA